MTQNGTTLAVASPSQVGIVFSAEERDIISRHICEKANEKELELFIAMCQKRGLNPITKQVYFIKYSEKEPPQHVTSIDAFRLIAKRSGDYLPGRPAEFEYDTRNNLVSATAYVKCWSHGEWHEVWDTAFIRDSTGTGPLWKSKPGIMLAKVAEARILRRTWPEDLGGLYTDDEISPDADISVTPPNPSQPPVGRVSVARTPALATDTQRAEYATLCDKANKLGIKTKPPTETTPSAELATWVRKLTQAIEVAEAQAKQTETIEGEVVSESPSSLFPETGEAMDEAQEVAYVALAKKKYGKDAWMQGLIDLGYSPDSMTAARYDAAMAALTAVADFAE